MKNFSASAITCYEENGVLTIGLGDNEINPANFIIITRLDDEDNATVDDGIGLQTGQAKFEKAGAIKRVTLHSGSLEIVIKPEFEDFFGGSKIVAQMPKDACRSSLRFLQLKEALEAIFNGSQVEIIIWHH